MLILAVVALLLLVVALWWWLQGSGSHVGTNEGAAAEDAIRPQLALLDAREDARNDERESERAGASSVDAPHAPPLTFVLRGRVLDLDTGGGFPDARVGVTLHRTAEDGGNVQMSAVTSARGEFVVTAPLASAHVSGGSRCSITITHRSINRVARTLDTSRFRVNEAHEFVHDAFVASARRLARVKGVLVDEQDEIVVGAPLSIVSFETAHEPADWLVKFESATDGHFEAGVYGSLSRDLRLVIFEPGFVPTVEHLRLTYDADLDLGRVVLRRGATLSGRVADLPRSGACAFQIECLDVERKWRTAAYPYDVLGWDDSGPVLVRWSVDVDEDGRFSIGGLREGAHELRLWCASGAWIAPALAPLRVTAPASDVALRVALAVHEFSLESAGDRGEIEAASLDHAGRTFEMTLGRRSPYACIVVAPEQAVTVRVRTDGHDDSEVELPPLAAGTRFVSELALRRSAGPYPRAR